MIRKSLIVALYLGALATLAIEAVARPRPCPRGATFSCPARLDLSQSADGSERFVYAAKHSWYLSVGYLRLKSQPGYALDQDDEKRFHSLCLAPMALGGIAKVVRRDGAAFQRAIVVPRGSLVALFAAYPALAFIRGPLRRWHRRRRGGCAKCGYDLTGNTSGACPECGTENDAAPPRRPPRL